jgi:hypothetical protein
MTWGQRIPESLKLTTTDIAYQDNFKPTLLKEQHGHHFTLLKACGVDEHNTPFHSTYQYHYSNLLYNKTLTPEQAKQLFYEVTGYHTHTLPPPTIDGDIHHRIRTKIHAPTPTQRRIRPLNNNEREQLLGLPPGWITTSGLNQEQQTNATGNGWDLTHIIPLASHKPLYFTNRNNHQKTTTTTRQAYHLLRQYMQQYHISAFSDLSAPTIRNITPLLQRTFQRHAKSLLQENALPPPTPTDTQEFTNLTIHSNNGFTLPLTIISQAPLGWIHRVVAQQLEINHENLTLIY